MAAFRFGFLVVNFVVSLSIHSFFFYKWYIVVFVVSKVIISVVLCIFTATILDNDHTLFIMSSVFHRFLLVKGCVAKLITCNFIEMISLL